MSWKAAAVTLKPLRSIQSASSAILNIAFAINPSEVEFRKEVFGSNAIADKKLDSFLKLCWDAVQDLC